VCFADARPISNKQRVDILPLCAPLRIEVYTRNFGRRRAHSFIRRATLHAAAAEGAGRETVQHTKRKANCIRTYVHTCVLFNSMAARAKLGFLLFGAAWSANLISMLRRGQNTGPRGAIAAMSSI
jgi:hypothetical protein